MSLIVRKTNITTAFADAIVNAENTPNGYGGSIVAAGGPELAKELERIGPCAAGEVKLTGSYDIPGAYKIQYIIHTTAPPRAAKNADKLIARCYRKSLELASELGLKSIAFPLISGGDSGFTKARALEIARREIAAFLSRRDMAVYLVGDKRPDGENRPTSRWGIFSALDNGEIFDELFGEYPLRIHRKKVVRSIAQLDLSFSRPEPSMRPCASMRSITPHDLENERLKNLLESPGETFSQKLLRMIDERGLKDPEVYKKAHIDRKLFSKIRTNRGYSPKKSTVLLLALALELPHEEATELLKSAGYAFSDSDATDIIIEYFISCEIYDIERINEALFEFEETPLGV